MVYALWVQILLSAQMSDDYKSMEKDMKIDKRTMIGKSLLEDFAWATDCKKSRKIDHAKLNAIKRDCRYCKKD